jgi:hypothetical protein
MKKEEEAMLARNEILNILQELEPNERKWILDVQIPQYFCSECGDHITDCECEEK